MATALTIFTIVTGVASLLGLAFVFFGTVTPGYRRLCAWSFGGATLWSLYVLFVPSSAVETNVADKLSYFRTPTIEHESNSIMVQRGELAFSGFGPLSIEFPSPFLNAPRVEVINVGGYEEGDVPKIRDVTPQQFTLYRSTIGGIGIPQRFQTFRWVARGTPLDPPAPSK
ncbi:MAG: hypothetical protein NTZ15_21705 [Burkholderiales bacterium]|nr:hypothetical protein [Burkholderiales bacterium]